MSGPYLTRSLDVGKFVSSPELVSSLGSGKSNGSASENTTFMNQSNKSAPVQSGPIIAGNCISCMGMVRISHSLSVNTTVRCPHCQKSFVLAELLDQSLPPLEVVSSEPDLDAPEPDAPYIDTLHLKRDEQANKPEKPRVKFEIPKALRDGAKKKRRRRRRSSSSSSSGTESSSKRSSSNSSSRSSNFVIPSSSPTTGDKTTMGEAVERRRSGGSRRSSSKSGSGSSYRGKVESHASRLEKSKILWSTEDLMKSVGGVLLAMPIAYLMLLWIFKADPVGLAKPLSSIAPFVVPPSMQVEGKPESEPEPTTVARDTPDFVDSYEDDVKPFAPKPIVDGEDRIAIPNIDPDEVFGQEFGL